MCHLVSKSGLRLIWQKPCHEALLLRHLNGCQTLRPQTTADACEQLRRHWPGYAKGLSAADLARKIDFQQLQAAAGVEPDLNAFLAAIGFPI